MLTNEELEILQERFYNRFNKYNTEVLQKLGETIKMFEGLTPSQAHVLQMELKQGLEINKLVNKLSELTNKSVIEIYDIFEEVAKKNVNFSEVYYKARNMEFVKFEDNKNLQRLVRGLTRDTVKDFLNLTDTRAIGFVLRDDKTKLMTFKPLKEVYTELIDKSVYNVSRGVTDYQSAMRDTLRQLANSGVKTHEENVLYKNGYSRRIDSSVRQVILDGVRKVNIEVQKQVGEEFGADGYEISVHSPCAEDHQEIQGHQYSISEFNNLNSSLVRPIGQLNCKHFIYSIILGINKPQYTQKQLDDIIDQSNDKIEFDGKEYTKYEATQLQRQIETAIRKQKDKQIIARSSDNKELIRKSQDKISILTRKYKELSDIANLPMYKNRLTVSGYKRVAKSKIK